MSPLDAPLPPMLAMRRVGHGHELDDGRVARDYLDVGADIHRLVQRTLPEDWSPVGKRILDFGAGAGRAIRHFDAELEAGAELWGCDIDGPSIEWAQEHLPQCTFFENGETPPLEVPDRHFDLVYAMSVFTHITRHWSDWLLELHRVLKPDGLLIASFLGASMHQSLLGEPLDEQRVGMLVLRPGARWDEEGGPLVFHSPWWLEAHWSPAFEPLRIADDTLGHGNQATVGHGLFLGRRTAERPARAALLAAAPDEPREAAAALHNVDLLSQELERLRGAGDGAHGGAGDNALGEALRRERALHEEAGRLQESLRESATAYEAALEGSRRDAALSQEGLSRTQVELEEARAQLDGARRALTDIQRSASWRATAPLRRLKRLASRTRTSRA